MLYAKGKVLQKLKARDRFFSSFSITGYNNLVSYCAGVHTGDGSS